MDPKITGTAHVGYEPEIKQPVKPISLDIGRSTIQPIRLNDFVSPEKMEQMADEDKKIINDFLTLYADTKTRLDVTGKQLDDYLSTLAIPYDPSKFPDLAAAHQHICGRPGATPVITYRDIQNRWALEKEQVKSTLSIPRSLDDLENMNNGELQSLSSVKVEKMIQQMLKQVLRQIITWVLNFLEKIFAPVLKIKIANIIPKKIRTALSRILGKEDPLAVAEEMEQEIVTEKDLEESTSDQLAAAGGGYISSVKEVAQSIVEELPPECLQHTASWKNNVEALVRDTKYAPAYYAKRTNMMANDRIEALNKLAAIGIPNGHVATVGGTEVTYNNPLPEEYLQARADGSTKISAFGDGLVESIKQVNGTLVPKLEKAVKNLLEDPTLLCCLIKNLIGMAQMKDLKKILLYIQALLQLYRNLLVLDIAAELAKLGNMIIDLVNMLLQSVFSAYTALFLNALNKKAMKRLDLEKLRTRECEPWNELINVAIEFLTDLLQKIWNYLTSFFVNFNLDISRLSEESDKIAKLAWIDRLLDIINKIIKFTAAWAACVESKQDPRVILAQKGRLVKTPTGIKLLPTTATKNIGGTGSDGTYTGGVGLGVFDKSGTTVTQQELKTTPVSDGSVDSTNPLSATGLSILLTNYLGKDTTVTKNIISSIDDCSCDKALSMDELREIQRFFKG